MLNLTSITAELEVVNLRIGEISLGPTTEVTFFFFLSVLNVVILTEFKY